MGPSRMLLSKPVIAAISGYAVAGGLELACWCDLRVVEEDATLGVFCRRVGVPLIDGGTIRLSRLIGLSRALDLILTGRGIDAAEAHAMGLANRVVPKRAVQSCRRGPGPADRQLPAGRDVGRSAERPRAVRDGPRFCPGQRVRTRPEGAGRGRCRGAGVQSAQNARCEKITAVIIPASSRRCHV